MKVQKLLKQLYVEQETMQTELEQINAAITALEVMTITKRKPKITRSKVTAINGRRKRHMTAAGRRAISQAAKARWAKRKAAAA